MEYFAAKARRSVRMILLGMLLLLGQQVAAGVPAQAYLARQFLLAVLGGQYQQAYQLLAPEAQARLSRREFRRQAEPLYQAGRTADSRIELYRLGLRLGEQQDEATWFYAFTFKRDSTRSAPVQLDVSFRDTTATQVLDFRLLPGRAR